MAVSTSVLISPALSFPPLLEYSHMNACLPMAEEI